VRYLVVEGLEVLVVAQEDVILWYPDVARDGHHWEYFRANQFDAVEQIAEDGLGFIRHISKLLSDHRCQVSCDAWS